MTDVLALAKERRAVLVEELAKLDEFLRMAMALERGGGEDEDELRGLAEGFILDSEAAHEDELVLTDMLSNETAARDMRVGKMIRYRRWMMGMSQEQLAELVGLSLDWIEDYESGIRHASASVLRNMAVALEVPVSFFLDDLEDANAEGAPFFNSLLPDI